jgi:hypothetical protein
VHAVVAVLLSNAAATESVAGVFFTEVLLGGGIPSIPGLPDGSPVIILGPTFGLALLAVVTSELGRDLKIVSRKVHGRTVYFVSGPGLHGIVLVFGSSLGSVLVIGHADRLPPGFLAPVAPTQLVPVPQAMDLLPAALHDLAVRSQSASLAVSVRRMASAAVRPLTSVPSNAPSGGAPAAPAAPVTPSTPAPVAPTAPTSSSSSSTSATGAHDGGPSPISAVLVDAPCLQDLMFAGLVRLRQWAPSAPTPQLLGSPG